MAYGWPPALRERCWQQSVEYSWCARLRSSTRSHNALRAAARWQGNSFFRWRAAELPRPGTPPPPSSAASALRSSSRSCSRTSRRFASSYSARPRLLRSSRADPSFRCAASAVALIRLVSVSISRWIFSDCSSKSASSQRRSAIVLTLHAPVLFYRHHRPMPLAAAAPLAAPLP